MGDFLNSKSPQNSDFGGGSGVSSLKIAKILGISDKSTGSFLNVPFS